MHSHQEEALCTLGYGTKTLYLLLILCSLFSVACSRKQETQAIATSDSSPSPSLPTAPVSSNSLSLPLKFERRTGDLDEMVKRRNIRVLVVMNPIGFFYDKGTPKGAIYEALEEFQRFVNQKLRSGTLGVRITYLPMAPAELEAALAEGIGDLVANAVAITPEREQKFAFSTPIQTGLTQIVVSGPNFGSGSSLEEFGGKEIYVNPLMTTYENLQKANASLRKAGKTAIQIKTADKNLNEDGLIQMVNAGLIPATVATKQRAELWSKDSQHCRRTPM